MFHTKKQNESAYSIKEIAEVMRSVGLDQGDTVFVHADLQKFGYVKDSMGYFALALPPSLLFDAFYNVLGDDGTVVVPTFSYSWPTRKVFSAQDTSSLMGTFSEYVRKKKSTLRSYHPLLSVAAIGKRASEIVRDVDKSGFGANSPYGRLYKLNAKFVMVGVPFCSFKDYVEVACNVPYRYNKYFRGQIKDDSGIFEEIYEHSVRYLNRGVEVIPFYDGLSDEEKELVSFGKFRSSFLLCIESQAAYDLVRSKLQTDPLAFIKADPPDAHAISLVHNMLVSTNKSKGEIILKAFAVDEEGTEKWIWSVFNSDFLDKNVIKYLHQNALHNSDRWWLNLVPPNTEFVLSVGKQDRSGAETALKVMNSITTKNCMKITPEFKKEFVSILIKHKPLVYRCR